MTLMQTPSKAGDLDGQGRRSRDVEAVWVMPLQAKGCHRLPAPRAQAPPCGLKSPPPHPADRQLALGLPPPPPPPEGRVYSVSLVETGPAVWGSQDPLLCRLCARVHNVCVVQA